jgi:hypothetical protein
VNTNLFTTPYSTSDVQANHLSSFVSMSSSTVAVPNSNSIFCRLLLQWMTRSGLTRDYRVEKLGTSTSEDDSNGGVSQGSNNLAVGPFDRLHTAYPDSWTTPDGRHTKSVELILCGGWPQTVS